MLSLELYSVVHLISPSTAMQCNLNRDLDLDLDGFRVVLWHLPPVAVMRLPYNDDEGISGFRQIDPIWRRGEMARRPPRTNLLAVTRVRGASR